MYTLNCDLARLQMMAPVVRRMLEDGQSRLWTPGLIALCCQIDMLEQARKALDGLAVDGFSGVAHYYLWMTCMVYCAEACVRLGDVDNARVVHDLLLPYSDQTANYPGVLCFGSVARYLGELATFLGEADLARKHFGRAVQMNRTLGAWPALARTQLGLARLLCASEVESERTAGRRLIADAEEIAGKFAMVGLVAEISAFLNDGASQLPDGLTRREVEVLKLLAIGRSNKDISKVLIISLSTVATHVRSILTKSGCANRTEAAAYAMRRELT